MTYDGHPLYTYIGDNGPGQVVYKVKAVSNVDGVPAEPFALAATNAVTPLATPQPITSLQVSSTQLKRMY